MRNLLLSLMLLTAISAVSQTTNTSDSARMQWFADAKLGIFIHYGIYAVNGIDESWSFYNGKITHENYLKQLNGFTASKYDAEKWADLFALSGARYAVLTSKHHDGVALYPSKAGDLNVVKKTPAKRDLIQPYADALRKRNIKVGLYYSLIDWSHPDYPNFTREKKRYENDSIRWNKFLTFMNTQLDEISQKYNPDLWWFDGDWEFSAAQWNAPGIRKKLLDHNANTIINSRLQGYGDYATPENGIPVCKPEAPYWELCMTMNTSWGYQPTDNEYKTPKQVIEIFADCIGMGGNMLLDIGPKEDGSIDPRQEDILRQMGRWTSKHSEAIFGTIAGVPREWFAGPSTLSKDRKHIYLFIKGNPGGEILLKGLSNNVSSCWVVGNGNPLNFKVAMKPWWSSNPGLLYIELPDTFLDPDMTVVCVSLTEPLKPFTSCK